ncbi:MAG TPA: FAD-dependent oxidoreductase [Steroidobacteraceae bacterium]|nr:FAD-dependent oxidoreductase [Steroidobacteraceae bacterium]
MPSHDRYLSRRQLLQTFAVAGGMGLSGCATPELLGSAEADRIGPNDRARFLAPLRARTDRIFDITVCLRPFRAAGPRLDTERIRDTLVVHNYGHGGSGWSLSWGSSTIAVDKALAASKALAQSSDRIAVVGCGVLGLTSALLAQAAGKQVTIYAREMIQQTTSARASGSFTPDSRIALADAVSPEFPALWEAMARTSLKAFRSHLGLPGDPVRWIDRYVVSDHVVSNQATPVERPPAEGELQFAAYFNRLQDLFPRGETLRPTDTPFRADSVRRRSVLMFNIASYAQILMTQFHLAGGRIVQREFHDPQELAGLPEKVVIDCTGYGARALWRDESVVPVRGQIAYLIPQAEFDYALAYRDVNVIPRSDGIVVQAVAGGDMRGYYDESLVPDRQESDAAVQTLTALYSKFRRTERD